MANLVLPDSSFYIRCMRVRLDPFQELRRHLESLDFFTCGVVITEVSRGLREPHVRHAFQTNIASMTCIETTTAIWERVAQLAWSLDRRGEVLQVPDLVIAACALHVDAAVLTFDAHFQHIPGLRVLDRLT